MCVVWCAAVAERTVDGDVEYKLTDDDDDDDERRACHNDTDAGLLCVWLNCDVSDVSPLHRLGSSVHFSLASFCQ